MRTWSKGCTGPISGVASIWDKVRVRVLAQNAAKLPTGHDLKSGCRGIVIYSLSYTLLFTREDKSVSKYFEIKMDHPLLLVGESIMGAREGSSRSALLCVTLRARCYTHCHLAWCWKGQSKWLIYNGCIRMKVWNKREFLMFWISLNKLEYSIVCLCVLHKQTWDYWHIDRPKYVTRSKPFTCNITCMNEAN